MCKALWAVVAAILILPLVSSAQTDNGSAVCTTGGVRLLDVTDLADIDQYWKIKLDGNAKGFLLRFNVTSRTSGSVSVSLTTPDLADGSYQATPFAILSSSYNSVSDNFALFQSQGGLTTHFAGSPTRIVGMLPREFYLLLTTPATPADFDLTLDCWTTF